ncbi:Uncharacterised protein [Mycobacterium tuberculosis]|uniref:Uncharacterized protein n=2 Tax=Mycobacterium tuberculosis TaxID=1773 RepID=A0A0T7LSW8_MYCTX|nr:Uncharacterised protein [Mycobacterium tuberculosis]CFB84976.1 Uncharacterised protein [Mycobacterium tuberculosis]CFB90107.1 Uncharacterised protein [Mycobacterium tuberculosis]CFB92126.1 Uncharacterised protein [Mycobacterium tuberculosis]CFE30544.1 Uncharacterised protein [Mycobacterium tuberculosis]
MPASGSQITRPPVMIFKISAMKSSTGSAPPELFELECWDWALDFRIRGGGTLSGIERTAESATA